ncbi:sigma 54-interacting response regulator [Pedobacter metabolipauper]|uniref:Transcriptional regulator with GAF, ATPase, and Fis domain n=1 Tax=Pedobacter metabolipauper TaxID=425513 RepID=A0A4R6STH0_9SPHI|nr:sigma 54-interacting response regulator [Pedobacter metabolipauper]TDQ07344.1 transcriptional regulator with GAF, ATPase, and Fis domain [Pedobacter metabolipauper]
MNEKILIVEDEFIEAHDLQLVLEKAGYRITGIARSVDIALKMIREEKPDFVMLDIFLKGDQTGIDLARYLSKVNIPFVYLSANSSADVLSAAKATHPYGFLVKPFREKDVLVTLEVARYHHEYTTESDLSKSIHFQNQLDTMLEACSSFDERLIQTGKALQNYIPFEYLSVGVLQGENYRFDDRGILRIGFDEYQYIGPMEMQHITKKNVAQLSALSAQTEYKDSTAYFQEPAFVKLCRFPNLHSLIAEQFQVHSLLYLPLAFGDGSTFYFNFYSSKGDGYGSQHIRISNQIKASLTIAVERILLLESANSSKNTPNQLSQLDTEIIQPAPFEGMVGSSHQLLKVFDQISQVASTNTSVLLMGESGTGKERVASCIHYLSERRNKPFIKVNCARLPGDLMESELFGHEKGAFTGAVTKRTGKFELANNGTILLDEVGEMNIDIQVKLLRVLQEQEIEPIGGSVPVKIDVRIIAATNKSLEKEISEGKFRLDLYYRLFVFPIHLPALRDRKEDIPALVAYFTEIYNKKLGKSIRPFSDKILQKLKLYSWPGNIRELEHLIERTFLMTKGDDVEEIALPLATDGYSAKQQQDKIKTILENERDHILTVLRKCNGKVWGEGGAAELLNIPPSTLNSKIRKLGINKFNFS